MSKDANIWVRSCLVAIVRDANVQYATFLNNQTYLLSSYIYTKQVYIHTSLHNLPLFPWQCSNCEWGHLFELRKTQMFYYVATALNPFSMFGKHQNILPLYPFHWTKDFCECSSLLVLRQQWTHITARLIFSIRSFTDIDENDTLTIKDHACMSLYICIKFRIISWRIVPRMIKISLLFNSPSYKGKKIVSDIFS